MRSTTRLFTLGYGLLLLFLTVSASHAETQSLYWVFLTKGANRSQSVKIPEATLEKMQSDHVGNLGRLYEKGLAFTAGPLGDNGFIRGIVILNVTTPEAVKECFLPDPFVQNGILDVQSFPCTANMEAIHKPDMPFRMIQHTFGVVMKGEHWKPLPKSSDADVMPRLLRSLKSLKRSGDLAVSGTLGDAGERLGVLLFRSSDIAQIQAKLTKDPAVQSGRIRVELHPQFFVAGVMRDTSRQATAPPKSKNRVSLFDGKTFEGWSGDTNKIWRVEAGTLIGGSLNEKVPHNDFLTTVKEYKNFDLRLKVKLIGNEGFLNGGVQIRSQRLQNPTYEMSGFQADMGEGYWGSLYDESRRNHTLAQPEPELLTQILRPNRWNDYLIRCEGKRLRLWLNGVLTVDYTENDSKIPLKGYIGLQIHGGGKSEAQYKSITIEELPD